MGEVAEGFFCDFGVLYLYCRSMFGDMLLLICVCPFTHPLLHLTVRHRILLTEITTSRMNVMFLVVSRIHSGVIWLVH